MNNIKIKLNKWNTCSMYIGADAVGKIEFIIKANRLFIIDILAHNKNDRRILNYKDLHIGTELIKFLLINLKNDNINISEITGRLSYFDALNGNWVGSIKFYADLRKYIDNLEFRLYEDNDYINEIIFDENLDNWNNKI